MAGKSNSSKKSSMDTGTKVVIGLASAALLFAIVNGRPDNDAWEGDDTAQVKESGTEGDTVDLDLDGDGEDAPAPEPDDPWTRGGPPADSDDDEPELPADDPWTRGGPPADSDDDEPEAPVDDPWTRGRSSSGGDALPLCAGTMGYETDDGRVQLPTDIRDEEWASADCTLAPGQAGDAVWLVQVALNLCNGQPVATDSVNGDQLQAALAAVQAEHGIGVDGGYGPATREVMAWPTDPEDGRPAQCVPQPDIG